MNSYRLNLARFSILKACALVHVSRVNPILSCSHSFAPGLYVTEGVREILQLAAVFHVSPTRENGLDESVLSSLPSLTDRVVVIIDSVINTGATLLPVLEQVRAQVPALIVVLSLVTPWTPPSAWSRVARTFTSSSREFRPTNTREEEQPTPGNRLFGTLPRRKGAP